MSEIIEKLTQQRVWVRPDHGAVYFSVVSEEQIVFEVTDSKVFADYYGLIKPGETYEIRVLADESTSDQIKGIIFPLTNHEHQHMIRINAELYGTLRVLLQETVNFEPQEPHPYVLFPGKI